MKLAINQRFLLINPNSGKEVGCKVVRVEGPASALYEIAFDFDQRTPHFWPISSPPGDWTVRAAITSDSR
jgi:hypothetical protein